MLRYCFFVCCALLAVNVAADSTPQEARTVVLWISLDGFMPDYLDRVDTPAFDRLMEEGAYTRHLVPIFPSMTFPSHVSQATGVNVREHGIPANSFLDTKTGQLWRYPPFASLLDAEPIWLTAQRQGIRTAVIDWPLSHAQQGAVTTDYFGDRFDRSLTDAQRLEHLLNVWRHDENERPLQLLMGYAVTVDNPGHRFGPDAPKLNEHIAAADQLIGNFMAQVLDIWQQKMSAEDQLYVFITSDHGMRKVEFAAHPERLVNMLDREDVQVVSSGNIAHVYLNQIEPESAREAIARDILAAVQSRDFAHAYQRADLPEQWDFNHPTRTGDIVVVLDPGYVFNRRAGKTVLAIETIGGPLGAHGYDPRVDPNMHGLGIFWRFPEPIGGYDLGEIDSLQLHPTAAKFLNIQPAPGAAADPFELTEPPVVTPDN